MAWLVLVVAAALEVVPDLVLAWAAAMGEALGGVELTPLGEDGMGPLMMSLTEVPTA